MRQHPDAVKPQSRCAWTAARARRKNRDADASPLANSAHKKAQLQNAQARDEDKNPGWRGGRWACESPMCRLAPPPMHFPSPKIIMPGDPVLDWSPVLVPRSIHCPECHTPFAFSPALIGRTTRCSACRHSFAVTGPTPDLPPPDEDLTAEIVDPTASIPVPPPLPARRGTANRFGPPPIPNRSAVRRPLGNAAAPRRPRGHDDVEPDGRHQRHRAKGAAGTRDRPSGTWTLIGLVAVCALVFAVIAGGIGYMVWPKSGPNKAGSPSALGEPPPADPGAPDVPLNLDDILKDVQGQKNGPPGQPGLRALPAPKFGPIVALPLRPTPLTEAREERALAGPAENLVVGGGGRLLLLHIPQARAVAVFDVNEGRVVTYLPTPDDRARIAAGMDFMIVHLPATGRFERWSLTTFKRTGEARAPFAGPALAMALGSASAGPLVVAYPGVGNPHDSCSVDYFDPANFRQIEYEVHGTQNPFGLGPKNSPVALRVSADGSVITGWSPGSPSGAQCDIVKGSRLHRSWKNLLNEPLLPAADGQRIYAKARSLTPKLEPVDEPSSAFGLAVRHVPAVHGPYFLIAEFTESDDGNRRSVVQICQEGEKKPVLALPDLPELEGAIEGVGAATPLDGSVALIPAAQLLVVVPPKAKDKLVLYRVELPETGRKK